MRFIKILAIGVIGFILGLGLWKVSESGYVIPWEKLPTPPKGLTEIIPTGDPPFYIKTSDGLTYYFSDWHNEGWLQKTVPPEIGFPVEIKNPCNFRSLEFLNPFNTPKNINACFQETTMYADGYIKYAVVLDNSRNVWVWEYTVTPDHTLMMICFPFFGLLIGLFLAFVSINPFENPDQI